jgi:hypothetical protein
MGRVLLRLLLVFAGIAAVLVVVRTFADSRAGLLFVVGGGLPVVILAVVFAALYQRPRDR